MLTGVARPGTLRSAVLGSVGGKAAELITLVALATVVPRVLGPAAYGRFAVLLTIVTVGTGVLALGGTGIQARFVPAAPAAQRPALAAAIVVHLARVRAWQLAALAVLAAILVVSEPAVFPPLPTALTFVALTLAVVATLGCQAGLGLGRTMAWNVRYPVHNAVLVLAVVWLQPRAGLLGSALALVLAAGGMLVVAAIAGRDLRRGMAGTLPLPDELRRFGRLQGAGWALSQLTHRGGVLVVALLAGSTVQTGYAALAIGTALPATYAVLQLFTVTLPHVAVDASRHGELRLRRLAGSSLTVLLPTTAIAAVLLPELVVFAFGDDYALAARSFAPALGLVALSPLFAMLVQVAALRVQAEATSWSALLGAAAFLLVAVATVPRLGALGATTAALVGAAMTVVVAVRRLPGATGIVLGASSGLGAAVVAVLGLVATG